MEEQRLEPIIESYNTDEEYLYEGVYKFIKGVANGLRLHNTLKALPTARMMHNGQYRKGLAKIHGKEVKLPYVMHVLKVCSTLISLNLPLPNEELDYLYASALLHDVIEDRPDLFPRGGIELVEIYGFNQRVCEVCMLLSKQPGSSEYELNKYFNAIKHDKLAILIKISDRSHNVEDLYNMKNIPKYIDETRKYFLENGICTYGKEHYPELSDGITNLKSKILSLTETSEYFTGELDRALMEYAGRFDEYEKSIKELETKNKSLASENEELKKQIEKLKKQIEKGNA